MSGGGAKLAIFPSRANEVYMKHRLVTATKGLSLLKRKRDALELRYRELKVEMREQEEQIIPIMQEAIIAMSKANFLATDFKPSSVMGSDRADAFLHIKYIKVVGMQLPTVNLIMRSPESCQFTGIGRGGEQVLIVRQRFQEALKSLISLASLRFSVSALQDGIRTNNMRMNGLDYVVIPRYRNTIDYIKNELEEMEREDFYRLKRSQEKQRKIKAKFQELVKNKGDRMGGALMEFNPDDFDFDGNAMVVAVAPKAAANNNAEIEAAAQAAQEVFVDPESTATTINPEPQEAQDQEEEPAAEE